MRTSAPGLDEHRGAGQHALNTSDCFRLRRLRYGADRAPGADTTPSRSPSKE